MDNKRSYKGYPKKSIVKKRKRKRKSIKLQKVKLWFKRIFLVLFGLATVTGVIFGIVFLLSRFFSVNSISVNENEKYSSSEVIDAGDLHVGENLVFLNTKSSEEKIYKSLTYIDEVSVRKKFPNKIEVSVGIAEPKYSVKSGEEYWVMSSKNKILEKSPELSSELINISGAEIVANKFGKAEYKNLESKKLVEEILVAFESKELKSVKEIDISDLQNIHVNYDNRININLGDKEDIDYKVLTAKEIINNKISISEKGILNLKDLKDENRTYFTANS